MAKQKEDAMNKKDVKGILYGKVSDFAEKVAPIYKALDWKWLDSNSPPTQAEIERTLEKLIDSFSGEGSLSTGGLEVFYDKEDSEIGISFRYCDSVYF